MPPASILQTIVEQVASKLQIPLAQSVIQQANERLRILETRCKTGQLGKFDRSEARAAIVLEHIMRTNKERLSLKELATAVGMKVTNLSSLQSVLGNYLATTSTVLPTKRRITENTHVPSKRLRSEAETVSSIPEMALKLAALITDPHGCAQVAGRIIDELERSIRHKDANERRGYLYDFQRYRAAYETAALYYVCKDKERQAHLDLNDMIEASTCTYLELKQVLPRVTKLAEELKQQTRSEDISGKQKQGSGKRRKELAVDSRRLTGQNDKQSAENTWQDDTPATDIAELEQQSFERWRDSILAHAVERAREQDENLKTDEQALAWAARDILRKHGLLEQQS